MYSLLWATKITTAAHTLPPKKHPLHVTNNQQKQKTHANKKCDLFKGSWIECAHHNKHICITYSYTLYTHLLCREEKKWFYIYINQFDPFNYSFGFRLMAFISLSFFFLPSLSYRFIRRFLLHFIYLCSSIYIRIFSKGQNVFQPFFVCHLQYIFFTLSLFISNGKMWNAKSHRVITISYIEMMCHTYIEVGLKLKSLMFGCEFFLPHLVLQIEINALYAYAYAC